VSPSSPGGVGDPDLAGNDADILQGIGGGLLAGQDGSIQGLHRQASAPEAELDDFGRQAVGG
jgi:hypothetical protein